MTRLDTLIVGLAASTVLVLFVVFWRAPGNADLVEVMVAGEVVQRLPLDQNRRFEVEGKLGVSTLEVVDGRARFVTAPCPGKLCIHSGWQEKSGEVSVCLPNGVSLRIAGLDQVYDAINF